jgi:hypothetical protein
MAKISHPSDLLKENKKKEMCVKANICSHHSLEMAGMFEYGN